MSKNILLLGSGFVTTTVVEYLTRRPENKLTIASRTLSNIEKRVKLHAHNADNVSCVQLDISKVDTDKATKDKLYDLVEKCDVAISLVPYVYHLHLAKACIAKKKNMVTSSYISDAMRALEDEVQKAGITIMNEIGVDPGIDHLAAVKIIDDVKKENGKVVSFLSWCGGLPAPENSDNPLKYKFSWSPKGVLTALTNKAAYLEDGKVHDIEPENLMKSYRPLKLHETMEFEGYPNRNSVPYQEEYHIEESKTVLRGTLRFKGFCDLVYKMRSIGLVDPTEKEYLDPSKPALTWSQVFQHLLETSDASEDTLKKAVLSKLNIEDESSEEAKSLLEAFEWFGFFGSEKVTPCGTLLDTVSTMMGEKMSYKIGERDMIFLQHIFEAEYANGKKKTIKATLNTFGDPINKEGTSFTAMAKTTGYPCAIASQLVLDGVINRKGVFGPMNSTVNNPILEALEKENIVVEYETIEH